MLSSINTSIIYINFSAPVSADETHPGISTASIIQFALSTSRGNFLVGYHRTSSVRT